MDVFGKMFDGMVAESKPESRVSIIGKRIEEIITKQKETGRVRADEIEEFKALVGEVKELLDIK